MQEGIKRARNKIPNKVKSKKRSSKCLPLSCSHTVPLPNLTTGVQLLDYMDGDTYLHLFQTASQPVNNNVSAAPFLFSKKEYIMLSLLS